MQVFVFVCLLCLFVCWSVSPNLVFLHFFSFVAFLFFLFHFLSQSRPLLATGGVPADCPALLASACPSLPHSLSSPLSLTFLNSPEETLSDSLSPTPCLPVVSNPSCGQCCHAFIEGVVRLGCVTVSSYPFCFVILPFVVLLRVVLGKVPRIDRKSWKSHE